MSRNLPDCLRETILATAWVLAIAGCGPIGPVTPETGWSQAIYLPYVEDVVVPATAKVGVPFPVTLRLSMASGPDLKATSGLRIGRVDQYISNGETQSLGVAHEGHAIHPYVIDNLNGRPIIAPPPGDDYTVQRRFDQPGTYYLHVASAKRRDQGGTSREFTFYVDAPRINLDSNLFEYREYAIEVTE